MNKLGIATTTMALLLTGAVSAQVRPGEPAAGQAPGYAVDGITLGSKLKLDSAMYREYKCSPSEQFEGFTWCQKSRRDSEKRGSFDVIYSILHTKNGTVVYVNRYQQPAFFDTNEPDRDIQNYSRKFGGVPPQITKMPRRSGSEAMLATWGDVELVPLDSDSMKVVAQGKSPRKGLLIDFIGNFPGSAQEGLPVYRITGGAGFVWAGTFDPKGRGAVRFAAVDASALQPGAPPAVALQSVQPAQSVQPTQPVEPAAAERAAPPPPEPAAPPPTVKPMDQPPAAEAAVQPPPPKPPVQASPPKPAVQPQAAEPVAPPAPAQPVVQPPPGRLATRPAPPAQSADPQPSASQAELAAAIKARRDAEVTVAQLQTELSVALQAKTEAEQARVQAERVAQEARSDAEIARKEFEVARSEANAANDEIDRLASGGMPASYIKGAIFIGISAAAVLFFIILAVAKILVWMSAKPEPDIDQDELVTELAKTLGVDNALGDTTLGDKTLGDNALRVEEPATALPAAVVEAGGDQPAVDIDAHQDAQAIANGNGRSIAPGEEAAEGSLLASTAESDADAAKSIVPNLPNAEDTEPVKPAHRDGTSQPAGTAAS